VPRQTRRPSRPRPRADETPQCRHFGQCGGCSLLDQPIAWQLHDKVEACTRQLAPFLGGRPIECAVPDRPPLHYRTRLLYPVRRDRDGLPIVGIYAFRSHELVRIEECRTQDRWLTGFGRAAEQVLRELRLQPFEPRRNHGHVKAIWARLAAGSGEVLAGVVTRPGAFAEGQALAAALQQAAAALPPGRPARRLVGVVHAISDRDDPFLLGDRHLPLRGRDYVVDRRDGLEFKISAGSFYQVHARAHELLYAPALALCGDVRGAHVVDGYGGVGCFGLRFAQAGAASVTIVEDGEAACRDAEHNASRNGFANVRVRREAFAGARLPETIDLLVVDPPRSGLQPAGVARVFAARPARVLYVACAVDALERDLGELCANGYRVAGVRLCDLFPHTEHVELLAMLERT